MAKTQASVKGLPVVRAEDGRFECCGSDVFRVLAYVRESGAMTQQLVECPRCGTYWRLADGRWGKA